MLKELVNNLLEPIALLIVLLVLFATYRNWKQAKGMKILFVFFLLAFANIGIATCLAYLDKPNAFWYNTNGFCSLACFGFLFYNLLKRYNHKKLVQWSCLIGLGAYLFIIFFLDDNITFNSPGYAIGSVLICLFSLLYIKEALTDDINPKDRTIWIVCSLLTYYLSSFLIHVSYKLLTNNFLLLGAKDNKIFPPGNLWGVQNVILFLTCIAIAFNILKQKEYR